MNEHNLAAIYFICSTFSHIKDEWKHLTNLPINSHTKYSDKMKDCNHFFQVTLSYLKTVMKTLTKFHF